MARRRIRHWKQRFNKDAEFVWSRDVLFQGKQLKAGSPVDKEALGAGKLRTRWDANYIELAEFDGPVRRVAPVECLPLGKGYYRVLAEGVDQKVRGALAAHELGKTLQRAHDLRVPHERAQEMTDQDIDMRRAFVALSDLCGRSADDLETLPDEELRKMAEQYSDELHAALAPSNEPEDVPADVSPEYAAALDAPYKSQQAALESMVEDKPESEIPEGNSKDELVADALAEVVAENDEALAKLDDGKQKDSSKDETLPSGNADGEG